MFRTLALALLLIGIVFITIGYTKMSFSCPPPRIMNTVIYLARYMKNNFMIMIYPVNFQKCLKMLTQNLEEKKIY